MTKLCCKLDKWILVWFQVLDYTKIGVTYGRSFSFKLLNSNTLGFFSNMNGQQIPWGRDRPKHFWNSWSYNFVSFKEMFRKLIKAIILDSRNVLDLLFPWLLMMWLPCGQLKQQNSQKFLLQKYVISKCDTLQKSRVYKIEELVRFEISNFISVKSQLMTSQNGFLLMRSINPKNE